MTISIRNGDISCQITKSLNPHSRQFYRPRTTTADLLNSSEQLNALSRTQRCGILYLLENLATKEKPECIASVLDGKIDASIG